MSWVVAGVITLALVGVGAWFYPQLSSHAAAAWRMTRYRTLAVKLGVALSADGAPYAAVEFMPTVVSVFGPFGSLRNVISREVGGETTYLFEYLFGSRPSRWAYRRGVAVVAVEMAHEVPVFTLQRPRGRAESRTTTDRVRGQRLVVHALGELELWCLEGEQQRARNLIGASLLEELANDPGWDLRGVDQWLVLFNGHRQHARTLRDLEQFLERATHLRRLLRTGSPSGT
jgi:hypothetical protein